MSTGMLSITAELIERFFRLKNIFGTSSGYSYRGFDTDYVCPSWDDAKPLTQAWQ